MEAAGQIKLLFQLWDTDNSKTIDAEEFIRGLVTAGLGGSPGFTSQIVAKAFGMGRALQFSDFTKLYLIEPRFLRVVDHVDRLAGDVRKAKEAELAQEESRKAVCAVLTKAGLDVFMKVKVCERADMVGIAR